MRIAVVGCGAMGSIYAGLLASDANDVTVIGRNEAHVLAIRERGLRISGASGDRIAHVRALTQVPDEIVDLVILSVKATHVASAAASAQSLIGEQTLILTIQNGLGSAEVAANVTGGERLIIGIAQGFGASLKEPGHVHHSDMKSVKLGAFADLSFETIERISDVWRHAGFNVEAVQDIVAMQWEKLICNVAYSALCALTGKTVGEVMGDAELRSVSRAAATEAWQVARARGVRIGVDDPVALVSEFASRMPNAKPSVLLDIEAGRISEIDVINGAVPLEAERAGMSAPINATLTALVKALPRLSTSMDSQRLSSQS